jgi:hypothetical protein
MPTEHEAKAKKLKRKQMLRLYKKALSSITSANTHNVKINLTASFSPDSLDFGITVLDTDNDNVGIRFYDFMSQEKLTIQLNDLINIIKTDDFLKIQAWASDK